MVSNSPYIIWPLRSLAVAKISLQMVQKNKVRIDISFDYLNFNEIFLVVIISDDFKKKSSKNYRLYKIL